MNGGTTYFLNCTFTGNTATCTVIYCADCESSLLISCAQIMAVRCMSMPARYYVQPAPSLQTLDVCAGRIS